MNNPLVPKDDNGRTQCGAKNATVHWSHLPKHAQSTGWPFRSLGFGKAQWQWTSSSKGLYNACSYTKSTAILCLKYSHWKDTSMDSLTLLIIWPRTWIEFSDQRGHGISDRVCCNQEIITKTPTTTVSSSSRITARTCQRGWRCT